MKNHAHTPRVRTRTAYKNYLRPRRLIHAAFISPQYTEAERRKISRRASAKIIHITTQAPASHINVEDYLLEENRLKTDHSSLKVNRKRRSLFKKTVSEPYHSKSTAEKAYKYAAKKPKQAKASIVSPVMVKANYKLVFAITTLVVVGLGFNFYITPALQSSNTVAASTRLYDEDMTVSGLPLDISAESQVLGAQSEANNPSKVPASIYIPGLNIASDLAAVGLHPNGTVALPKNKKEIGWYKASSPPATNSTVLLTGFREVGLPFSSLTAIKNGDLIELSDKSGDSFWYHVATMEFYAAGQVPMSELITINKGDQLVIIVNNGVWLPEEKQYSERIVVVAKRY